MRSDLLGAFLLCAPLLCGSCMGSYPKMEGLVELDITASSDPALLGGRVFLRDEDAEGRLILRWSEDGVERRVVYERIGE